MFFGRVVGAQNFLISNFYFANQIIFLEISFHFFH